MKPKLAIISDTIRRDLHHPFSYFKHFEIIHLYQKANYGDMTEEDLKGTLQFRGPFDLYRKLTKIKPNLIQGIEPYAGYSRRFKISIKLTLLCLIIYLYAKITATPYFFPFFENLKPEDKYGKIIGRIAKLFAQIYCRSALLVFALNKAAVKNLTEVGVPAHKILSEMWGSWGVDVEDFKPAQNREKKPTLLFVGRIEKMKGVDDLYDAFVVVKKKYPDLTLWLVGDGSQRRELAQKKDVVSFGIVKHKKIISFFQKAWITVSPSKTMPDWAEQVGMVNIQSIACATPIISTISGSIADYIKKEFSILVPENNPQKLAAAILELLGDKEKRKRFGKIGREYAKNHYNDRINVNRIEALLVEKTKNLLK